MHPSTILFYLGLLLVPASSVPLAQLQVPPLPIPVPPNQPIRITITRTLQPQPLPTAPSTIIIPPMPPVAPIPPVAPMPPMPPVTPPKPTQVQPPVPPIQPVPQPTSVAVRPPDCPPLTPDRCRCDSTKMSNTDFIRCVTNPFCEHCLEWWPDFRNPANGPGAGNGNVGGLPGNLP